MLMSCRTAARSSLVLVIFTAGIGGEAQASSPADKAAAQALYSEALQDFKSKNFSRACPKLEEAARLLEDGLGVTLKLGYCYSKTGRLASAWTSYSQAWLIARDKGHEEKIADIGKMMEAIRSRCATLTIIVPDGVRATTGITIKRDGMLAGEAQWGTAIPVDKGEHSIVVTVPGRGEWRKTVTVSADGVSLTEEVGVPPELPAPPSVAAPPALSSSAILPVLAPRVASDSAPKLKAEPEPTETRTGWRSASLGAGGAGLVVVGVGAAYGIDALAKANASRANPIKGCAEPACDPAAASLWGEAQASATKSTALLVGGASITLAAAASYLLATKLPVSQPAKVSVGLHGVSLSGEW